ncbi:MAG: hypothetical protein SH848_02575 [Saprospiraceae bacterium]|nr:hypothetical protein [Saprospiraceae bacterium]MDZ4702785.1 hypothetical protein [Saprospiraceae bacterium]
MDATFKLIALISYILYKGIIFVYLGYMAEKVFKKENIHYKVIINLMAVGTSIELLKYFEKITPYYYEKAPDSLDYYAMLITALVIMSYILVLNRFRRNNSPTEQA